MPPWHIDKTVGIQEFKNDRSLSDDQIATIVKWVDQGAPQGDPKDMPPPKVWPNEQGWNYAALVRPEGAGPDHPLDALDAEGGRQRHLVEADRRDRPHRAALGARDRGAARHGKGRKITHHANADLLQVDPDAPDPQMTPGRFRSGPSARKGADAARTAAC